MDEQLTTNFARSEFRCRGKNCCGGSAPVEFGLVIGLQLMRDQLEAFAGRPVSLSLSCGFRCLKHNRRPEVGSDDASEHPKGRAADVPLPDGVTIEQLIEAALIVPNFEHGGIGVYDWGVHVDDRGRKARWDKRTGNHNNYWRDGR